MGALPIAFASPWVLSALVLLPAIWLLLRLTPPRPRTELFPPLAILARLVMREQTPARSPWWLTLLRLAMAAFVILAMSGPVLNPREAKLSGSGPVALIVDNGWASASQWESRVETARGLISEAEAANRPVILLETAGGQSQDIRPVAAPEARKRVETMLARPLKPSHEIAAGLFERLLRDSGPQNVVLLSDGLEHGGTDLLAGAISQSGISATLVLPDTDAAKALGSLRNDPDAMTGTIMRPATGQPTVVTVEAMDIKGLPLARQTVTFGPDAGEAQFRFEQPVELRNQIARVALVEGRSAGGVQLLDDRFRRRLVGIVSGEGSNRSQALLAPLYYIQRALSPFSDIRTTSDAGIVEAVPGLLQQNISALVLADVGRLPDETQELLSKWIDSGGTLIRFAGPRLAAAGDDLLLPVRLRQGDRNPGGALSWETPKAVAPFERGSPFFGIDPPREVTVQRQVLALQDADIDRKTWARLEDGTPLVTAETRGGGLVVLFHVGSNADWSNLPISGTFVEMLRRVVIQSKADGVGGSAQAALSLPPLSVLNGKGELTPPDLAVRPLSTVGGVLPVANLDNPPGLYGTEDGFVAVNLFTEVEKLLPLDKARFGAEVSVANYAGGAAQQLSHWFLALAALGMMLDCLAVLWIAGALRLPRSRAVAAALALVLVPVIPVRQADAQDDAAGFSAALETRLAYVVTGDSEVDDISKAGLGGLSRYLASRTALEPGEPAALDIEKDELAFYPLIYWPISLSAPIPSAATMARIEAFMKGGGTVLFDTRGQGSGAFGGTSSSPEAQRLQAILSSLDIPPLQPTPQGHVLTKAFYLLNTFPGRYYGGELWVEQLTPLGDEEPERQAQSGDGVSPILITSNDFAAAWAVDANGQSLLPVVSQDVMQRELAFRTGVNIVMYAMTGNYKADQVHIPALLERLGQ